jgi:hypothetical protein
MFYIVPGLIYSVANLFYTVVDLFETVAGFRNGVTNRRILYRSDNRNKADSNRFYILDFRIIIYYK